MSAEVAVAVAGNTANGGFDNTDHMSMNEPVQIPRVRSDYRGSMMRSSVIGKLRTRIPVACQTAFATAPAVPVIPSSPTPLMPSGIDVGIVFFDQDRFERRHVGIHGDVRLGQIGVHRTAGPRIHDGLLV